ncbi:hypothetical protein PI124_g4978 [Phytophthora idaei]|nr:hypothetical protein PI125_g4567 [Phytophthora idaei]KAG3142274.1 hypothetical protein PI126_g15111 [Phytophthora idaei]KAG3250401.1 hypothetical protein PI124_g4978 [Phytophthora idaei]
MDFCEADGEDLERTLKGPSAAAAQAPPSLPAATPAAAAPTTSAAPRTSPAASSARTPHATVRESPAKQRRKPQKAAATGKRRISSRVKLHSDEEELSEASRTLELHMHV